MAEPRTPFGGCRSAPRDACNAGPAPGWFASPAGREPLGVWATTLAAASRRGAYDAALEATRRLFSRLRQVALEAADARAAS